MAATVITANINSARMKICELSKSVKGVITIHRTCIVDTPEGCVEDGRLIDIDKVAQTLKETLDESGITSKEIIFGLISSKIAYKEVVTPVLKGQKLKDMIQANASDYFPVNIDEYIIAENVIELVESAETGRNLRVNVYAAPADMVESYYELAKRAGLTVKHIGTYNESATAFLSSQIGTESSVVIQVHDESTSVSIFKDKKLKLTRNVPYGKNVVVQALVEKMGISESEAERLIATDRYIHNTFDGDEVTESLRYLINSIVRVVDYYTSRNSENTVEKAYLTGESVLMLGLENLFANEFQFSVMQLTEFEGVAIANGLTMEKKYVSLHLSCIGALISTLNFKTDKIEVEKKYKSIRYLVMGAIVSFAGGLVLLAAPVLTSISLDSDIEAVEDKIDAIAYVERIYDDRCKSVDKLKDAQGFLGITTSSNDYLPEFIGALKKGMPSDISIKSMTVNNGQVSIAAETSTKQSIAKFIMQLNSMPGIYGAFVSSSSESKDEYGVVSSAFNVTFAFSNDISYYLAQPESGDELESLAEEELEGEVE